MLVVRAGINIMLVRIAIRKVTDLQKQTDLTLPCFDRPFSQATIVFKILEHLP